MSQLKAQINQKLQQQDLYGIEDLILAYQQEAPEDLELISIKVMYFLMIGNYEEALGWARIGVRKNPYNTEVNYNLAYVNELMENYYDAFKYYCKAMLLAMNENNQEILGLNLSDKLAQISERFMEKAKKIKNKNEADRMIKQISSLSAEGKSGFGLLYNTFKDQEKNIGRFYQDYDGNEVYVGHYGRTASVFGTPDNMVQAKGELRKIVANGNLLKVNDDGCERIIPILSETVNNVIAFKEEGEEHGIRINNPNYFSHFKVKPGTMIQSLNPILIGRPIPLKHDATKKKLVLNLFIDGLSQVVLEEEGFESVMPNTYQFFSKGTIFQNAYSASEWTYPGIPTYMTGLHTTNHMMMHNKLNTSLPNDVTLLTEYFSQAGYQTGKIDGDWRLTPNYGYLRGVDRTIFQHQWTGMRTQEVVGDAIDHLELMKDTDHFLWLGIGDLHDIADEISLQASVESKLYPSERVVEHGATSAKQPYSNNKRSAYINQAKMIDRYLGLIYNYIEDNYQDDEIVVSLFADHGQGYLVKPNEFFLSPERTRVAFMFRGGDVEQIKSKELVSSTDYIAIMCKLCNIPMRDENIDGRLPAQFGGEAKREYVITESIHPKDPYYASVYWEEYVCNFKSVESVGEDGRFNLNEGFTIQLMDYSNNEIIDEEKKARNLDIIIEHIAGLLIYE